MQTANISFHEISNENLKQYTSLNINQILVELFKAGRKHYYILRSRNLNILFEISKHIQEQLKNPTIILTEK
jgi:hypothetical protein